MRVRSQKLESRSDRFWARINWLAFVVWLCLQAISFTIHLDLGIAVSVFPIVQATLSIFLILLSMSAILNRSKIFCRLYVVGGLIFSAFLLSYIVWKILLGTTLLRQKNPSLNLSELRAFYVINCMLIVVTLASCYCMCRVAQSMGSQDSSLTGPNLTSNSLDSDEPAKEHHTTMLPFLALKVDSAKIRQKPK